MITSTSNAKVKYLVNLKKKRKERDRENVFLVEGIRMFREVPADKLKEVYEPILKQEGVIGINIGTRADSITDECLEYLEDFDDFEGFEDFEDFDDFVQEIWDFNYITGITDPIHVWVQHLKNQDTFMTFSSLNNGKFVPYFNKSLEVNLEFVEIAAENDKAL